MSIRLPRIPVPTLGPAHIVLAVALLLLALFAYSTLQTMRRTLQLSEQRRELQAQVYDLRTKRAELQGLRRYLQSDEYIEAVARDRFGLVMPGEIAVEVDATPGTSPQRSADERWWEALFTP